MPRFRVSGEVTISVTLDVDAPNEAAARSAVEDGAEMQGLCHQCSGGVGRQYETDDLVWHVDELDGTPTITAVEMIVQQRR